MTLKLIFAVCIILSLDLIAAEKAETQGKMGNLVTGYLIRLYSGDNSNIAKYYDVDLVEKISEQDALDDLKNLSRRGKILIPELLDLSSKIDKARSDEKQNLLEDYSKLACKTSGATGKPVIEILIDRYKLFAEYWRAVAEGRIAKDKSVSGN